MLQPVLLLAAVGVTLWWRLSWLCMQDKPMRQRRHCCRCVCGGCSFYCQGLLLTELQACAAALGVRGCEPARWSCIALLQPALVLL